MKTGKLSDIFFALFLGGLFSVFFQCGLFAKEDSLNEILETINLTKTQKDRMNEIRIEEESVLIPYILDLKAKEEGLEYVKNLECGIFDFSCKTKLKEKIKELENGKNTALRHVIQKKQYYKIRYTNLLTKEQNSLIKKKMKEKELTEKIILEQELKAKNAKRVEKLKFWTRFKKKGI